jgi:sugar phosphate isomerase/epimerase
VGGSESARTVPLTLWASNLIGRTVDAHLEAARAGGFSSASVFPSEVRAAARAGISPEELSRRFTAAGAPITVLDPLALWLPGSQAPPGLSADDPAAGDIRPDEMFRLAEALGADRVTLIAVFDGPVDAATGAAAFARLCDAATEYGLRLQLEYIPQSGISGLALAWEIVRLADRPNGGLLIDAWHFFRCGPEYELLGQIPPDRVFALQLDDAPVTPAPDVAAESLHARRFPGEGELDLRRFVGAVLRQGIPACIGPEVFNDELRSLSPGPLGRRLAESSRAVLQDAWPHSGTPATR